MAQNDNKPKEDKKPELNDEVPATGQDQAEDAKVQGEKQAELQDENVNDQGEPIDGRRNEESEKPRPEVNRPTLPVEAPEPDKDKTGGRGELKQKDGEKYYVNRHFSAGTVTVRDKDGEPTSEVVRFTPYYDQWKGDQVRVGYLATDNKQVQKTLETDENVEEISFSEYKTALRGDGKRNKPLNQAPIPAA